MVKGSHFSNRKPPSVLKTNKVSDASDELVVLINHCTKAATIAEGIGEKFLAYLIAMATEEARAAYVMVKSNPPVPAARSSKRSAVRSR